MQEQAVKLIRHGKYHMKIRHRKQILFSVLDPRFPLRILALGAMTVTAGVITDANVPALIASVNMPSQGSSAATLKGAQRALHKSVGGILFNILFSKSLNDLCQLECRLQSFLYNLSNGLNRLLRLGFAT